MSGGTANPWDISTAFQQIDASIMASLESPFAILQKEPPRNFASCLSMAPYDSPELPGGLRFRSFSMEPFIVVRDEVRQSLVRACERIATEGVREAAVRLASSRRQRRAMRGGNFQRVVWLHRERRRRVQERRISALNELSALDQELGLQ